MKNYDPSLSYDPSVKLQFAGGAYSEIYRSENPSNWAKLDLTLTCGATFSSGTVDVFNYLFSSSRYADSTVFNTESSFQTDGSQLWSAGGTDTVSLTSNPTWASVWNALGSASVHIALLRMIATVTPSSQFNQSITIKKKTFLGGVVENEISPSAYLSPDQFQTDRVDIPLDLVIDAETGMFVGLTGNSQVVTLSLFIDRYKKTYGGAALKS